MEISTPPVGDLPLRHARPCQGHVDAPDAFQTVPISARRRAQVHPPVGANRVSPAEMQITADLAAICRRHALAPTSAAPTVLLRRSITAYCVDPAVAVIKSPDVSGAVEAANRR